ncbi:TfuA-like protein [Pelagibius sp.]|uniref:TfuA-like protein n=1 Tax=Pelagibius sp. TaxID=1931238 RepID=UPI00260947D0|nr:TfuA-like protein [Pelagibius sp.]
MSQPVVYLGPTLSRKEAMAVCDADYRPPAQRGDVIRAVTDGAKVIGIVDGLMHQSLAVTHKEILFALDRGTLVLGAASLGALRAAELARHGMIGVGRIFEAYRDKTCTSDEVAVSHGPVELGYPVVSEAMVNVRATVEAAVAARVLSTSAADLIAIARSLHFPQRTWPRLIEAAREWGLAVEEIDTFVEWLPTGRVDQKRLDAIALLQRLSREEDSTLDQPVERCGFQPTQAFADLYRRVCAEAARPDDLTATSVSTD